MLVLGGVLIGAAIAAGLLWKGEPSPALPVTRFAFTLAQGQQLTVTRHSVAVSPDGTRMVYAADGGLFVRSMSDLEARVISGTDPALSPVFSPDGQSLVFWSDSALKRIAIGGGTAVTICQLGIAPAGITWSNDSILFSQQGVIMRVSPNGGKPAVLLEPEQFRGAGVWSSPAARRRRCSSR